MPRPNTPGRPQNSSQVLRGASLNQGISSQNFGNDRPGFTTPVVRNVDCNNESAGDASTTSAQRRAA